MVDATLDVLRHHNGVVDHQSDSEDQGQQGQQVQGKAQRRQHDEGGQQTDRGHDRGDDGCAQTAQKDEIDQGHQHQGNADGDPDLVNGMGGEDRIVRADGEFGSFGQARSNLLHQVSDAVGNRKVIGLRLAGDGEADLVETVAPEQPAVLLRRFLDPGDVAEPGDIDPLGLNGAGRSAGEPAASSPRAGRRRCRGAPARADRQLAKIVGISVVPRHADRVILFSGFQLTGGQFDVLARQGGLNVVHRQSARRERGGIQPDTHRVALFAIDLNLGHAGYGRKAIDQIAIRIVGQLQPVQGRRAQEQHHDGLTVGIRLGDLGRIGLVWQAADDARNPIPHVVGGGVDVAIQ